MLNQPIKQIFSAFFCTVLLYSVTVPAFAASTSAASAILIEADSGRVLYAQNPDQEMLIASTTKIMTALVAIESCPLEDFVEVKPTHMAEGSSMYLRPGEKLTLETLLYGLMLSSGNDAALAVADHCGPGIAAFIVKMNEKARSLGMEHTSFANPNGLDDEQHYSTARDMARLAAYAMQNETFQRIVSTKKISVGERILVNHNKLLSRYEGCIGLKTGYTRAAGRTLVTCAARNDMKLIAVTLKDSNDWADHAFLYDQGFSDWHMERLSLRGDTAAELPVLNGNGPVPISYGETVSYPLREDESVTAHMELPSCIFAPVRMGEKAGQVHYMLNDKEIACVDLYYGTSVNALPVKERGNVPQFLKSMFRKDA